MQWLALWKSCTHLGNDWTVWSNNFKDFIVRDDPSLDYNYGYMCEGTIDLTQMKHKEH